MRWRLRIMKIIVTPSRNIIRGSVGISELNPLLNSCSQLRGKTRNNKRKGHSRLYSMATKPTPTRGISNRGKESSSTPAITKHERIPMIGNMIQRSDMLTGVGMTYLNDKAQLFSDHETWKMKNKLLRMKAMNPVPNTNKLRLGRDLTIGSLACSTRCMVVMFEL